MRATALQDVREALEDLEMSERYRALVALASDSRFLGFRVDVNALVLLCSDVPPHEPTPGEIRQRLEKLRSDCTGMLAWFKPFIDDVLAAHGPLDLPHA